MQRRDLLAAAVAGTALPAFARAQPNRDAQLRAALDGLARIDAPADKLRALASFDLQRLSPSAQLDLKIVRAGLAVDEKLDTRFKLGRSPYSVSPAAGAWREAAQAKDPDKLAARIAADSEHIRSDADDGVVLPTIFLDKTVAAITAVAAKAPAPLADPLRKQAELLASLRPASREPGVARLKGGQEYYALLLERSYGAPITPAEAHARLTAKARQLNARADTVLRRLGLTKGSVGTRITAAFRDPTWLYADSDAGRDKAVADMSACVDEARGRLPALFDPLPSQCTGVAVSRMTPKDEADGRQGYRRAPAPGITGAYFVDLKRIRDRPSWTLPSVVHHELLPGHMIQLPIEDLAAPHPLRIEYCPGFSEGWAIYAEQLMEEDGFYAHHDRALLGHLHWMLFRVERALIDTGLNDRGLTLAQVRARLAGNQGEPAYFASFDQDIERVALEPALRAADALIWLGLADRAKAAASRKSFHRRALQHGRKPLQLIG